MKEKRSLHLKVQELCDCYATTDPLREMSVLRNDADKDEAALKWLALAALHGVNANAEKISITRSSSGDVEATAKYRKTGLPSPGSEIGEKIIQAIKDIAHFEGKKGKTPLALGIRDSSLEISIRLKEENGSEKITLGFPG